MHMRKLLLVLMLMGLPSVITAQTGVLERSWEWDCDVDPTTLDLDNDGQQDWIVRSGAPFDTNNLYMADGRTVWSDGGFAELIDSRPKDSFKGLRIEVDAWFRSFDDADSDCMLWGNIDYVPAFHEGDGDAPGATFAPIYCTLKLEGGFQELTFVNIQPPTPWNPVVLGTISNLPTGFIHMQCDYFPPSNRVDVYVDSELKAQYTYVPKTSVGNEDAFWTVVTGSGELDRVEIRTYVTEPDPIHWWAFDQTATDQGTPGGNDGTVTGAMYVAGANKRVGTHALEFEGAMPATDYVDLGVLDDFDSTNAFSMTCWVKPATLTTNRGIIVDQDVEPELKGWLLKSQAGTSELRFEMFEDASSNSYLQVSELSETNALAVGEWSFVAVTYDGSRQVSGVKMWSGLTNVVELGTTNIYDGLETGTLLHTNAAKIGSHSLNGLDAWDGIIDDVRIFSGVLSRGQLQLVMDAWKPTYLQVEASAGTNGAIDPDGVIQVIPGSNITFVITPDIYYHVADVVVDLSSIPPTNTYTFENVDSNHSIHTTFTANLAASNTPEWWLAASHPEWTNNFDFHATNDFDNDWLFAWQEFIAGTLATNPDSRLALDIHRTGTEIHVEFDTIQTTDKHEGLERYYSLERRMDLLTGSWQGVSGYTNIPGAGQHVTYTNQSGTNAFCRSKAWLL